MATFGARPRVLMVGTGAGSIALYPHPSPVAATTLIIKKLSIVMFQGINFEVFYLVVGCSLTHSSLTTRSCSVSYLIYPLSSPPTQPKFKQYRRSFGFSQLEYCQRSVTGFRQTLTISWVYPPPKRRRAPGCACRSRAVLAPRNAIGNVGMLMLY